MAEVTRNLSRWDMRRLSAAFLLVLLGAVGRLLLFTYVHAPNVETVMVAALLAGSLLGGVYAVLVPIGAMALSDFVLYASAYKGYDPSTVLGIALFTWSGYVMASLMGRAVKPRMVMAVRGLALLTTISIPATIAYDVWTAFGEWVFITSHLGWSLGQVYEAQIPFTILHLMSSLIFVPLLGSSFLVFAAHRLGMLASTKTSVPLPQRGPEQEGDPSRGGS